MLLGREPELALVLAKQFSLRFLFGLTLGTYQVFWDFFCQTGRFRP